MRGILRAVLFGAIVAWCKMPASLDGTWLEQLLMVIVAIGAVLGWRDE
jgi:hypothetical protein